MQLLGYELQDRGIRIQFLPGTKTFLTYITASRLGPNPIRLTPGAFLGGRAAGS
jgi:hypothetical protein